MSSNWNNDEVIQRLREYLKIPSVHPDINYDGCVKFLKNQAQQLDLPVTVHELVAKKPIVIITWQGLKPELPSILLNSHMDVVPVFEESWTYPPFEAAITDDGWIYARGIQDMKSIGMMHLESIRSLKKSGIRLKRTVHISFVPDEETGGIDGMRVFAASDEFKKLNVGFELDESIGSENPNEIIIFYGERTSRQITVTCKGEPGHGSLLVPGTAGEKIYYIFDKFMKLRAQEKFKIDQGAWIGDVTTINVTLIQGGVQVNVLPESLSVSFDIRVATDFNVDEFDRMVMTFFFTINNTFKFLKISQWCKEAGEDVTFEYFLKNPQIDNTVLDDNLPFWKAMKKEINDMGITIKPLICPGATDARYVRQLGIPAINFSPLSNTPLLLHAHDERLHVDVYKTGINIMEKVVKSVANV